MSIFNAIAPLDANVVIREGVVGADSFFDRGWFPFETGKFCAVPVWNQPLSIKGSRSPRPPMEWSHGARLRRPSVEWCFARVQG